MSETARMAEQLGVTNSVTQAVEAVRRELNKYGSMVLERMSKMALGETDIATNHLYVTVRLAEFMSTSDEADLLRRRGLEVLGQRVKARQEGDDGLQSMIASGKVMEILRPDPAD